MIFRNLFTFILCLSFSCLTVISAQQLTESSDPLEQQYEEYISGALRLQVKADSLSGAANQKRRELAFINDPSIKSAMEDQVISLEDESFSVQKEADSLYTLARAIELRLMADQRSGGGNISSPPAFEPASKTSGINIENGFTTGPSFLLLGETDISSGLSPSELKKAETLETDFERANAIMEEVSDINAETEQLGNILNSNPRRRERRKINQRIEELTTQSFDKKMEAMVIYKEVNSIIYSAATAYLNNKRGELNDSLVIKSGLAHEELAHESFRQAAGLRETAVDLRSDKYLEGFILRAYTEELKAFKEMENALELYNTPPVQITRNEVPLRSGGRLDTGLALSRTRNSAREIPDTPPASEEVPDVNPNQIVDFGFSVLPEPPYSSNKPIPSNVKFPDGMVYTIQLGVFNTMLTPATFGGLQPVIADREAGSSTIRYFTGVFRTLPEAEKALIEVNRQGFSDAFLVAYNNNSKIPVTRARQMEQSRQTAGPTNISQSNAAPGISRNPEASITQEASRANEVTEAVVFKIQLGAFRELVNPDVNSSWQKMAGDKNLERVRNNNGLFVYSIGNFNTFEDAVMVRNHVRSQGIPDAFIVPYKNNERIRMEEANDL